MAAWRIWGSKEGIRDTPKGGLGDPAMLQTGRPPLGGGMPNWYRHLKFSDRQGPRGPQAPPCAPARSLIGVNFCVNLGFLACSHDCGSATSVLETDSPIMKICLLRLNHHPFGGDVSQKEAGIKTEKTAAKVGGL